jgi:hypothetical protein
MSAAITKVFRRGNESIVTAEETCSRCPGHLIPSG